jgi:hypothetical protein
MATTLERASFAAPLGGYVNLKFDVPTGIAAGQTLTVTKPDGSTLTGLVKKLLPYGSAQIQVTACSKYSGTQLLPKGSAVA